MLKKEEEMQIKIISKTSNPQEVIYRAIRQCYSKYSADEIELPDDDKQKKLIRKVLDSGHTSPIEHVSYTFSIQGVSRALTHQLVRHRIASYSQQSQRYVQDQEMDYVKPPSIRRSDLDDYFDSVMSVAYDAYHAMISSGVPEEDARYVLPNASTSKITVTMNCRSLLNFFELRCCDRAQWEIRNLAWFMLYMLREDLPVVFLGAGPKCESLKYCPEGLQFTCGRYFLTREAVMK